MNKFLILIAGFWLLSTGEVYSQTYIENDSTYIFEMSNGRTITGRVRILEPGVSYKVKSGKKWKIILDEDIEDFYFIRNSPEAPFIPKKPNQHGHCYFLSPSGYSPKKGEAYYQNYFIIAQHVSFGITDHFTLGTGFLPLINFYEAQDDIAISLTPKWSFPYKNGRGAFALYSGFASYLNKNRYLTSLGLSNTFGTIDKQLTIGVGYFNDNTDDMHRIHIFLNGMTRLSNNWCFLMENHYYHHYYSTILNCVGFKYVPKRFGLTFGFVTAFQTTDFFELVGIPWIGMAYKFE